MRTKIRVVAMLSCSFSIFCLSGQSCFDQFLAPTGAGTGGPTGYVPGPTPTPPTPAPITATITASKTSNIQPGENITFTAVNVQGGTPPYTYFWIMDHDAAFTLGGSTFTTQIDGSAPTRTVTLVVRDSTNTDSDYFTLEVTLDTSIPAVPTVCGDMSGVWATTFGTMRLTQTGNTVSGTYDYYCPGTITGTLTGGPAVSTACPDCLTWSGTWSESGPDANGAACGPNSGAFEFSVDPDLAHFLGKYSRTGESVWRGSWSGDHNKCGDGSDPLPRP